VGYFRDLRIHSNTVTSLLFLLFLNLWEVQHPFLKLFMGLVVHTIVFSCTDRKHFLWDRFREKYFSCCQQTNDKQFLSRSSNWHLSWPWEKKLWPQIVFRDFSYPAGIDERNPYIRFEQRKENLWWVKWWLAAQFPTWRRMENDDDDDELTTWM